MQIATKQVELEAELAQLKAEKDSWDALVASDLSSSRQEPLRNTDLDYALPLDPTAVNVSQLSPSQAFILATLLQSTSDALAPSDPPAELQSRVDAASSGLRFKLDLYHNSLHHLDRFVHTARRVADDATARGSARLEERDVARREHIAPCQPDVQVSGRRTVQTCHPI